MLTVYVDGSRKLHRRDADGDVCAIAEVKRLVVCEVYPEVET